MPCGYTSGGYSGDQGRLRRGLFRGGRLGILTGKRSPLPMKLTVTANTIFKLKPLPSRELMPEQKLNVPAGTVLGLLHHELSQRGHFIVNLDSGIGPEDRNTWHVWNEHAEIEGNEPNNNPNDSEPEPYDRGSSVLLPGYRSHFYLGDPILPGGNFTWAEATKNGQRIPVNKSVVDRVLSIADVMQEVREVLGCRPIMVTSWYRDPVTNRRVGGASRSQHIGGGALDFKVKGLHPSEVQRQLDPWWGSRGGLASASTFTHIDNRGYRARWRYGR